jgi:hypothetical protein
MVERKPPVTEPRQMVRGYAGAAKYIPYQETVLRALVKKGKLPPPVRFGARAVGFFLDDLVRAQQELVRENEPLGKVPFPSPRKED